MHKYVKMWLVLWTLLLAICIGAGYGSSVINGPITERTSWNATLEAAYEYGDRCGSKGRDTCSGWKGRFKEQITGMHFDKEISGFLYHSFIDGGSKPIATAIVLSKRDFGFTTPWYGDLLRWISVLAGAVGLVLFCMGLTIPSVIKEDILIAAREEYKAAEKAGNYKRRQELEEEFGSYELRYTRW